MVWSETNEKPGCRVQSDCCVIPTKSKNTKFSAIKEKYENFLGFAEPKSIFNNDF